GYVKTDGTTPMTADWDIGDALMIQTDKIQARDGAGLSLFEDGGAGIFVEDGGQVGIGTAGPDGVLEVNMGTTGEVRLSYNDADGSAIDYSKFEVASDGALTITTVDDTAASADIALMPDGNVGIGTAGPFGKLSVYGSGYSSAHDSYTGLYIDSGGVAAGDETYGAGIEFSKLGTSVTKKAAIVPIQSSGDNDNLGLSFWVSNSSVYTDPIIEAMRIDYAGLVGIGTASPDTILELAEDAADTIATISTYDDDATELPELNLRKADNTEAAPALVDDNDVLGVVSFDGHDGSGWHEGARIEARIDGTPSDGTDMPTELSFWTTPEASATAAQRMTIDDAGNVGIGTASPIGLLHTKGTNIFLDDGNGDISGGIYVNDLDSQPFAIWSGTGDMRFATGVTNRLSGAGFSEVMRIQNGGNVGIGTSGPDGVLEVNMGTTGEVRLSYNDADGSAIDYSKFEVADDGALTITTVDDTAASADIALMPDGNVGIGTVSPGTLLDVHKTDATTNAVVDVVTITEEGGTPAAGLGAGLTFDVEDAGGVEQQGSIDVALTTVTDLSEDADMVFSLNSGGVITEIARLNGDAKTLQMPEVAAPSGNPDANHGWLYVKDNGGTSDLYFEDDAGTVVELTAAGAETDPTLTDDGDVTIGAAGGNVTLTFDADGGTDGTIVWDGANDELEIANGEVGIGITNPGADLDILGVDDADDNAVLKMTTGAANLGKAGLLLGETGSTAGADVYYDGQSNEFKIDTGTAAFGSKTNILTIERDTGLVGIGTDSPDELLSINHATHSNLELQANGNNWGIHLGQTAGESDSVVGQNIRAAATDGDFDVANTHASFGYRAIEFDASSDAEGIQFYTYRGSVTAGDALANERMRITNVGDVGIGTVAPSQKLEITESTGANISLNANNVNIGDGDVLGTILFTGNDSDVTAGSIGAFIRGEAAGLWGGVNDYPAELQFWTVTNTSGTAQQQMVIDMDGEVGIGTASPSDLLEVSGPAGSPGVIGVVTEELTVVDGDKLGQIDFQAPLESSGTDAILVGASIWAEADDTFAADNNATELVFATGASATATEQMRIDSGGQVGIGTSTPQGTLNIENLSADTYDAFRIDTDRSEMRLYSYYDHENQKLDIELKRARGSIGSPTNVIDEDDLGDVRWYGYNADGTDYDMGARIGAFIDGEPSTGSDDSDMPCRLEFFTTPDGSATTVSRMAIKSDGNVGIGTTDPTFIFEVETPDDASGQFRSAGFYAPDMIATEYNEIIMGRDESANDRAAWYFQWAGEASTSNATGIAFHGTKVLEMNAADNVSVLDGSFSVGDGDTAVYNGTDGVLYVDTSGGTADNTGTLYDLAEEVYTLEKLEPGDVVSASAVDTCTAEPSATPYDTKVIGVVSTKPNIIFTTSGHSSFGGDDFEITDTIAPMVIAGRVPVKVTDENGYIEPGDLLTTSSTPGHAMKYTLLETHGRMSMQEFSDTINENERRRNSIIGKALESFNGEQTKIVALINLQ
ncbi:beta strand repeat-containing protein, partial [Candidatus Omnitrophota bacterium]